ncbi:MAG: PQQ-binding-like beta-propeller repeat protein [Pseudomonadota bacterium]
MSGRTSRLIIVLAGSACLSGLFGSVMSADSTTAEIKPAPEFTAKQLTAPPTESWLTNGGNLYNQRYSPLKKINRGNVSQLKGKWRTHLEGSGFAATFSGQGQPIVHDGVIYQSTGASDVFALSVDTGQILWRYTAAVDAAKVRVCCGWVNRGVALGDGKVFVGRLDAQIVALDQRTGNVLWSVQGENPAAGFTITSAPLYYDGLVITGFAGGEVGIRGRIKAFDAKTGKLVWTFYTIPGPGEIGHDTWPADNDAWKYGGAPIWQTPAVDPALGMIYFTTGNAGPDYNGAHRVGDNLFTVSMVALDVKTGKYRWHFQQVHHDLWDYDAPNPVILFDAPYAGKMRKGIAEVSKTGWVYILDRETGKPLLGIEEKPVPQEPRNKTAATQPYPVGDAVVPQLIDIAPQGFELVNQGRIFTPFWDKVVLYKPQMGVNWPPSSYDPEAHHMFICGADQLGYSGTDVKDWAPPGPTGFYAFGARGGAPPQMQRRGTFTAMDLTTNRIVWQQKWPDYSCMNGTMAVGGGLVFVGRADGRITALDSANGEQLWQFQTDAGVAAPPSTFERHGKQYVVVFSAGTFVGQNKRGDSVWLFSLDGSMESLPPESGAVTQAAPGGGRGAPAPAQQGVTLPPGAADLAKGAAQYRVLCMACHGESGMGGQNSGASLATIARDPQALANTAWNGKNNMPPFRGSLTAEQIRDIAYYISSELLPEHN